MEDYNKIIESLNIKFVKARKLSMLKSVRINNYYDIENSLIRIHKGNISFGSPEVSVKEGDILFVPAGRPIKICFGNAASAPAMNRDEFTNSQVNFFDKWQPSSELSESFSQIMLDVKVFDSVSFFRSLDIPAFVIEKDNIMCNLIDNIINEERDTKAGRERMMAMLTEQLVITIVRYILTQKIFVEKLATNSTYFKDPRLISIFNYIKENLDSDLSNKQLASVANVSEDYVGQYFKMLTGINPQDYIEYQRMEKAVNLLRTSKKSIRVIGSDVGYKDTAYFCRRFKMMFGLPAGRMRKRESLILDINNK